jgi:hypothetical protein
LDFTEIGLLVTDTRVISSFFVTAYKGSGKARELEFVVDLDPI